MSFPFDNLEEKPCLLPQEGEVSCTSAPPIIPEDAQLFLRPEVAIVEILGSVQYRTFLVANGVEAEVTSGLTYSTADSSIAVIGAIGGHATGIAEGIVTVAVTWQGLEAFAQLQVVESCGGHSAGMMVVLDRSLSMSQSFGFNYGTKLDFAKLLAKQFIGEVNVTKDKVGLVAFSTDAEVLEELTDDNVAVATTLMGVQFDQAETDITSGLQAAIDALTDVDRKVIVLFTDGGHNDDLEPVQLARQFRSGGGVIICVALRAGPEAFIRMEKVASGGFFMSAYNVETATDAMNYISGVKGYLCAGNCCPEGNVFVGTGQLNFDGFQNWDVTGHVDLIGEGLFDLIPGNGLYVDLVGSSAPFAGSLKSKRTFDFTAGHVYHLTYRLAGNQRIDRGPFSVQVMAGGVLNTARQMNDWRQDFTEYTEEFTGDGSTGQIMFAQAQVPNGTDAQSFGILLDSVMLVDMSAGGVVMFKDDFDTENLGFVPPQCGVGAYYDSMLGGYGYAYGYCCYGYGCLSEPIKAQHPDPNAPAEIEVEDNSPSYTATQSYTASCASGTTGPDVTRTVTYTSKISLADANMHALNMAREQAEAALSCQAPPTDLINLDFFVYDDGAIDSQKVGGAFLGLTAQDYWNPGLHSVDMQLRDSNGNLTTAYLRLVPMVDFEGGDVGFNAVPNVLPHQDLMYRHGVEFLAADGETPNPTAFAIHGLEAGEYTLVLYAHGPDPEHSMNVRVRSGTLNGNQAQGWTFVPVSGYTEIQQDGADYLSAAWIEYNNFVKYDEGRNFQVNEGDDTILVQLNGYLSERVFLAGIQLLRRS